MKKNNLSILSPIVLFVYNRPWHTQATLEALQKNHLAEYSDLIIYSDAPKSESARENVQAVRDYIKTINGFKSVRIIERTENWGLAKSIISGVTEVVNEYGRIIVLEDDIVTSPFFLKFMNDALEYYADNKKVWHISGWNYPVEMTDLGDVFLWRMMNCWGWSTWSDRWCNFKKDKTYYLDNFLSKDIKKYFNINNSMDFYSHLELNKSGHLDTWAIFWYASIFEANSLSLNPTKTYVLNIGFDGTGTHCGDNFISIDINQEILFLNRNENIIFNDNISENIIAKNRIAQFYKKQNSLYLKLKRKLWKLINI
jgi:hypothetical protein